MKAYVKSVMRLLRQDSTAISLADGSRVATVLPALTIILVNMARTTTLCLIGWIWFTAFPSSGIFLAGTLSAI